jgi:hypothetical protein
MLVGVLQRDTYLENIYATLQQGHHTTAIFDVIDLIYFPSYDDLDKMCVPIGEPKDLFPFESHFSKSIDM